MEKLGHALSDIGLWLAILKYLGLLLAAGSSIWGTVNVLTVNNADGRKQLTRAGGVAICMTITGLILSLASEDLQRRRGVEMQRKQVKIEARRTNAIIIAGQPLTSIELHWRFSGLPSAVEKYREQGANAAIDMIADQQGERSDEQNSAVFRRQELYTFLSALARNLVGEKIGTGQDNVVVLLALDDVPNAVLPFGGLDQEKPEQIPRTKIALPPASIELERDSSAGLYFGNGALLHWPGLSTDQSGSEIYWRLDPWTFAKTLNRQNQYIIPTANLPRLLRIAVLFDIEGLPFRDGNFALPTDQDFWLGPKAPDVQREAYRGLIKLPPGFVASVSLTPNNSAEISNRYRLNRLYETQFQDGYGEADPDLRCIVFEFALEDEVS